MPSSSGPEQQAQLLAVFHGEGLLFVLLLGEGLDHAHAGDVLLRLGGEDGVLLAHVLEGDVDLGVELQRDDRHDRRDEHHDQRQAPVDEEEQDERAEEPDGVFTDLDHAAGEQVADALDVAGHAGHDLADVVLVVEGVAHLAQVAVEAGP